MNFPGTRGYLYVMAAAVLWASSGTAGKALFNRGMTPFELVQIRVTLSTIILAVIYGLFARDSLKIRWRDLGYFFIIGGITMAGVHVAYFYAISKIQVAAAILLEYLSPIFVAVFSICFWKEKLTWVKAFALILAVSGCYLVVGGYDLQLMVMNRMGILSGLAAAVFFAAYTLLGERGMHRYSPRTLLFYALAFSALTMHVIYPPFHYLRGDFTVTEWGWIVYIVVLGTILPFALYFMGINYIRSTRAMITSTLEPISAGFIAFLFLGETLESFQIAGGGLVISAIVSLQLQRERDTLAPALIRARNKENSE